MPANTSVSVLQRSPIYVLRSSVSIVNELWKDTHRTRAVVLQVDDCELAKQRLVVLERERILPAQCRWIHIRRADEPRDRRSARVRIALGGGLTGSAP